MRNRLRIVVAGMAAQYPLGGVAWDYLQYVVGFSRLGHDVYYYEDTRAWPYQPVERRVTDDGTYSARFLADFFARYAPALSRSWHYRHLHDRSYGLTWSEFDTVAATADLFLNVSGASMIPDRLSGRAIAAFVDTDPGYNQILYLTRPGWSPNVERWVDLVDDHTCHLTYGERYGQPDCAIPATGHDWTPTRMPIVLDLWAGASAEATTSPRAWTTVLTWNDFKGRLEFGGREYRSKDAAFERLIDLPARVDVPLAVGVGGQRAPVERLTAHGWIVLDGPEISQTPATYQSFIRSSRGEISPAKDVYVALRTGWFSCRTACYLAAGVPAVVEDTGFAAHLPTGEGLMAFSNLDAAAAGIARVEADRERHAAAARRVAEEEFGYRRVLQDLLDSVGSTRTARASSVSRGRP